MECDEGWHQSVTEKSKAPAGNRKLLGWSFEQLRPDGGSGFFT
jgi:hypothetical protein